VLTPEQSMMTIPHAFADAQQLVIDRLEMRGFMLVERHATAAQADLRFIGNRDFRGSETIGSAFYATIVPVAADAARVTLIGKPTLGHRESCPSLAPNAKYGPPCMPLQVIGNDWGITGREEADVIRGVFAELQLEASMSISNGARGGA
jgi:hypothetical protein